MKIEKIKKEILKYDIISFDIFDTLIKRNCSKPTDIFKIVENRYNNNNNKKIDFYNKRRNAESKALINTNKNSVTLDEIYENISLKKEELEELKLLEIQTEIDYCVKNDSMYDLYKYCKSNDKKIICTSDMYLSKNVIEKILKNNSYNIDKIFVSCEFDSCKKNGKLFNLVLKEMNINNNKIIHIGDNLKADFIGAHLNRIRSIKIKKNLKNASFLKLNRKNDNTEDGIILSVINNSITKKDYYYNFGYEILGPVCLSFIKWINNISLENKYDNLLFCARDMKMIYEMYNHLYESNKTINSNYFYVSRKSTFLPFLYIDNSIDNFIKIMPKEHRKITIEELLDIYNIKCKNLNVFLENYNLENKKYEVNKLVKNSNFVEFYNNEIKNIISIEGKKQFENFNLYLKRLNVFNKNSVLIDLGWHGTTQDILEKIIKNNIDGLYYGLINDNKNNNKFAFMCQGKMDKNYLKLYPSIVLNELLFSALHGSTIAYSNDKDKPYILADSINKNNKIIKQIQSGAFEFIKHIKQYNEDIKDLNSNYFINKLINVGLKPSLYEANCLGEIYEEKKVVISLAKPKKIRYYLFHLKQFKIDFLDSKWKIGFLKRLLKIPFPYYVIYNFLNKKERKK